MRAPLFILPISWSLNMPLQMRLAFSNIQRVYTGNKECEGRSSSTDKTCSLQPSTQG